MTKPITRIKLNATALSDAANLTSPQAVESIKNSDDAYGNHPSPMGVTFNTVKHDPERIG